MAADSAACKMGRKPLFPIGNLFHQLALLGDVGVGCPYLPDLVGIEFSEVHLCLPECGVITGCAQRSIVFIAEECHWEISSLVVGIIAVVCDEVIGRHDESGENGATGPGACCG